eukprot:9365072-Pyramimonas_sp.AAC.1
MSALTAHTEHHSENSSPLRLGLLGGAGHLGDVAVLEDKVGEGGEVGAVARAPAAGAAQHLHHLRQPLRRVRDLLLARADLLL